MPLFYLKFGNAPEPQYEAFKNINLLTNDIMKKDDYVKQFLVGFFIPAAVLSLLAAIFSIFGWVKALTSWDILISPFFYGFYNIFYFKIKNKYPIKNPKVRYGIHGAILWVLIVLGYLPITLTSIHGHSGMAELLGPTLNFWWHLTAILYWPIIGYAWFAYLQKPLNEIVGLKV